MINTLILYASVHGHTKKICRTIADELTKLGEKVTIKALTDAPSLDGFDKVVIGASIRHGKHNPAVHAYVTSHKRQLSQCMTVFFSVSLVARKPLKNSAETNPYMQAFLKQTQWQADLLTVFAGRLNYPDYGFWDRHIIRFIMWLTKGPTDIKVDTIFTDWEKVTQFTKQIYQLTK